jgi:hypothetical protein
MTYESSNFRIVNTKKGYRVDIQKSKWTLFGLRTYWTHYISWSGMSDEPYYYKDHDSAMEAMLQEIKWDVLGK